MKKNIDIICKVSPSLWIGLGNTRKNYGHDDSLPYQADVFVYDPENCPKGEVAFKRVATIYNDGWGGESNLTPIAAPHCAEYIQTLQEKAAKHVMYWNGKPFGKYNLEDICDCMASLYIDNLHLAKKGVLEHILDDDVRSNHGENPLALFTLNN